MKFHWPFPIARDTDSSEAIIFGWKVYERDTPKWVEKALHFFRRLRDVKLWFIYRFDPKHRAYWNPRLMAPGFCDPDHIMMLAMMHTLGLYIKESGGVERLEKFTQELEAEKEEDPGGGARIIQTTAQHEALTIWHWWTVDRPRREKEHDEETLELFGRPSRNTDDMSEEQRAELTRRRNEYFQKERADSALEDEMLQRLLDIRRSLWT